MKVTKITFLILFLFKFCYSQTDTNYSKANIVISTKLTCFFFFIPSGLSINLSDSDLKNNFHISYCNNFYNTLYDTPGFEVGYGRSFFKKTGILFSFYYRKYFADFSYRTGSKSQTRISINKLELLVANLSIFHRFKLKYYGILEPSIGVNFFQPTRQVYNESLNENNTPRVFPTLEIKYYFKRNKTKK